jgi:quercetin dioxygenase-like cupin family protein
MKIVSLDEVDKERVEMEGAERAWKQLVLSGSDGAPTFSFRVFSLEPGGHTPFHTHEAEHLNYVLKGRGCVMDANGAARELSPGDFILVLPGEKHQYRNTSEKDEFAFICAVPTAFE